MEAQLRQPAAAPLPETGNWVNERRDDGAVDEVRPELNTPGNCTRNDGGSRCGKSNLEQEVCLEVGQVTQVNCILSGDTDASKANKAVGCATVHDAVTNQEVKDGAYAHIHYVFEQNVDGVLAAVEPSFYQGKTGLHKQNQNSGNKHRQVIDGKSQFIHWRNVLSPYFVDQGKGQGQRQR